MIQVARRLHGLLEELQCPSFVKTSGQKGIHVMVPLSGQLGHEEAVSLAQVLARQVCAELPEIATVLRPIAARGTRVYVDYLQNGRGKLIAAPLAVRPQPGAPVSMPLRWGQVTARLDPRRYTIRTAPAELRRAGDPFSGVLQERADLPAVLDAITARLGRSR